MSDELKVPERIWIDDELQYRVSMEHLWAHDRELISTLRCCIEELERENARLDAGWDDANARALAARLKLAKAMDALIFAQVDIMDHTNDVEWRLWAENTVEEIRTTLDELEKPNDI